LDQSQPSCAAKIKFGHTGIMFATLTYEGVVIIHDFSPDFQVRKRIGENNQVMSMLTEIPGDGVNPSPCLALSLVNFSQCIFIFH
jgi:hypothetical protein